jgi:hypothetical protein
MALTAAELSLLKAIVAQVETLTVRSYGTQAPEAAADKTNLDTLMAAVAAE